MQNEQVIFLNAFLRTPTMLFWDNQFERAHQIIPFLCLSNMKTSVIGLCEVFNGFCSIMKREVGRFGFNSICTEYNQILQTSGLFFAYKPNVWAYVHHEFIPYDECRDFDCLASKGFLHVQLLHKQTQVKVNFITTHLNTPRSEVVQKSQLTMLENFMTQFQDEPCVLMGDFNMGPEKLPETFGSSEHNLSETTVGGTKMIDYIFVRNLNSTQTRRLDELDFLSDHYPISKTILLLN